MRLLLSLNEAELAAELAALGQPAYRSKQILEWVYGRHTTSWDAMTNLPPSLRAQLAQTFDIQLPHVLRELGSSDSTRKFLLSVGGDDAIETVLIPSSPALYGGRSDRLTLCVSTQVGCAYGCKFCASGLDGWKRNLQPGEIVAQLLATEKISGQKVNNLVFMGMGEPLANFANLMRAIDILNAPWGPNIGARHITISTSGLVPQILDLAGQPRQIRLAISLHGATDDIRSRIMPVNQKYPVAELLEACAYYCSRKKQFLTFEYILIRGINDSQSAATELARACKPLRAKVNLIPCNHVEGLSWERPSEDVQDAFLLTLKNAGIPATLRREKGDDIAAACGQLRLQNRLSAAPR